MRLKQPSIHILSFITLLLFLSATSLESLAQEATPIVIDLTETPTVTPTFTATATITSTPTETPTVTPSPTITPSPTVTPSPTITPSPTNTPTAPPTATEIPTNTSVPTATSKPTDTPVPTWTSAPTNTPIPTWTPAPTATPRIGSDSAEPNNTPSTARPLTPGQVGQYLVGANDPADYFTLLVKLGTRYVCETETTEVDTELFIQNWQGEVLYYNDDRQVGQIDSRIEWTAQIEQTIIIGIRARGETYGAYALRCEASAPATLTAIPATPRPTSIPVISQPTTTRPAPPPIQQTQAPLLTPTTTQSLTPTVMVTTTAEITPTVTPETRILLPVRQLGAVTTSNLDDQTVVSLLIYYDANNDRKPSPNEGVPNVSVVVVNGNGQPIQQAFTSSQGEVRLTVPAEAQRLVVPFVSGWSESIQRGRNGIGANNDYQIGLQAVEIPVFIPVQKLQEAE